ncbi:MAG TPA: hypothetical protein VIC87_15130 [Vicinamibacteria bacterium]
MIFVMAAAFPGIMLARAAEQPPPSMTGTVVSTGNISIVVHGEDGQERSFVMTTTTKLADSVAAGDRVTVRYQPLDEGRFLAVSVDKAGPGDAEKAASGRGVLLPEAETSPLSTPLGTLAILVVAGVLTAVAAVNLIRGRGQPHTN